MGLAQCGAIMYESLNKLFERERMSALENIEFTIRYKYKGGVEDLNKLIHFAEMLKEIEYGKNGDNVPVPCHTEWGCDVLQDN